MEKISPILTTIKQKQTPIDETTTVTAEQTLKSVKPKPTPKSASVSTASKPATTASRNLCIDPILFDESPMSNAKLSETVEMEYVCTLCGQFSKYKQSIKRHIQDVHRIPFDVIAGFWQEREKVPPPIIAEKKIAETSVSCQTTIDCPECNEKEKKIRKLRLLVKRFKKTVESMNEVFVDG